MCQSFSELITSMTRQTIIRVLQLSMIFLNLIHHFTNKTSDKKSDITIKTIWWKGMDTITLFSIILYNFLHHESKDGVLS